MKVYLSLLLLLAICSARADDGTETLPTPEAQKWTRDRVRDPYYRTNKDVFEKLSKTREASRKPTYDRLRDVDYDLDQSKREDVYLPASSQYGDYGSDSGYGLSCASGYVNASAVALLAFLFLLNIVQDVIQQITVPPRRKRSADEVDGMSDSAMEFLANGGIDALKEGVPEVMFKLLVHMAGSKNAHCQQRPICEANKNLIEKYGTIGGVIASLSSNVFAKAFSGADGSEFNLAQKAALWGREGGSCEQYHECEKPFWNIF